MTPSEALLMVAKTEFKPFEPADYHAFSGVESDNPMLGEYGDWLIVIDGKVIQFTDQEMDSCYIFTLGDTLQIF